MADSPADTRFQVEPPLTRWQQSYRHLWTQLVSENPKKARTAYRNIAAARALVRSKKR